MNGFDSSVICLDPEVPTKAKDTTRESVADVIKQVAESKKVNGSENEGSLNAPKKSTLSRAWESNKLLTEQNSKLTAENLRLQKEVAELKHANKSIVAHKNVETKFDFNITESSLADRLNAGWEVMLMSIVDKHVQVVLKRVMPDEDEPVSQISQTVEEKPPTPSAVMIRQNAGNSFIRRQVADNRRVFEAMLHDAS